MNSASEALTDGPMSRFVRKTYVENSVDLVPLGRDDPLLAVV